MTAKIMDGKALSQAIIERLKEKVEGKKIKLASILIGSDEASRIYVEMKKKKCAEAGIDVDVLQFDEKIPEQEILDKISELNNDPSVTGILIQLPLPRRFHTRKVLDSLEPGKDADGLTSANLGKLTANDEEIIPCTPKGVMRLLEHYNIRLKGKDVCIVGASDDVGKPLGMLLLAKGATVTYTHIFTRELKKHTIHADIILSATGVPGLIKKDMVMPGSVVIDIGISKVNGKIAGDVADDVKDIASHISPVPGGVGPMTIAMLIENLIEMKNREERI